MNDERRTGFAESLLAQDDMAKPETDQLRLELQNMMTRQIPRISKVFLYVVSVVLLATGGFIGSLIVTESLPPLAQVGLALGVGFSIAWAWKTFRLAKAGEIHLKNDNRMIANMVWCFTLATTVLMLMAAGFKEDLSDRKLILITGQALFFLIAAATYLITQRMEQAELTTRERLLRLELKLIESNTASMDRSAS